MLAQGYSDSNPLPNDQYLDVFRANLNQLRHCWEQENARRPYQGKGLVFNLQIVVDRATGNAIQTEVSPFVGENEFVLFRGCLKSRAAKWPYRIDSKMGVKVVEFPLEFK